MKRRLGMVGNGVRALIALALLVVCVQDWPAARATWALLELPPVDHLARAQSLRADGQSQAAMLVMNEGLQRHTEPDTVRARLLALRSELRRAERTDWQGPLRSAVRGAVTGRAADPPGLVAAAVADLFVFGDVRDLIIQSGRGLRGEEVDAVIVGLSAAGLALTALPAVDGGTAVLKAARRNDALSAPLANHLMKQSRQALRSGDTAALRRVADDTSGLTHAMGVAPALRLLRGVERPGQLRHAARFARRPGGAYALWAGGPAFTRWLADADDHARAMALIAARRGEAGLAHLLRQARVMARPHPVLGIMKGIYKGNAAALASHFLRRHAALVAALAGGWLLFELGSLGLRLRRRTRPSIHATR